MHSQLQIKTPYKKSMRSQFTEFDSRERLETILDLLGQEIDFENFMLSGVIKEHFPLHRMNQTEDIIKCFQQNKSTLMRKMIAGEFYQHFMPINFIKSYYGEKFAFEFSFLIHYQAWLIFPTIFGVLVTFFQMWM